jgi:hypothetical protein
MPHICITRQVGVGRGGLVNDGLVNRAPIPYPNHYTITDLLYVNGTAGL